MRGHWPRLCCQAIYVTVTRLLYFSVNFASGLPGSPLPKDPRRIYHVTIMPCYDKKLEAARDELAVRINPQDGSICMEDGLGQQQGSAVQSASLHGHGIEDAMEVDGTAGSGGGTDTVLVPEVGCTVVVQMYWRTVLLGMQDHHPMQNAAEPGQHSNRYM